MNHSKRSVRKFVIGALLGFGLILAMNKKARRKLVDYAVKQAPGLAVKSVDLTSRWAAAMAAGRRAAKARELELEQELKKLSG